MEAPEITDSSEGTRVQSLEMNDKGWGPLQTIPGATSWLSSWTLFFGSAATF